MLLNQDGKDDREVSSDFFIDYTKANRKALAEYFETSETNRQMASANAGSMLAKQGAEIVKSLPLPKFFSKPQGPGYSATPNAQILQMIKEAYGVSQIWNFRFDKNDAPEYTIIKNELGIPLSMSGYRHFYFIVKDPNDGVCRVRGGYLYKTYLGGGKYSAPKLAGSTFILEPGENYPLDMDKHVIVDCAKAR